MEFSKDSLNKLVRLAGLPITPEEVDKFAVTVSSILGYVHQMTILNTEHVKLTSQVSRLENVLREDKVTPSLSQEKALANAPKRYKGFFVAKPIFQQNEV